MHFECQRNCLQLNSEHNHTHWQQPVPPHTSSTEATMPSESSQHSSQKPTLRPCPLGTAVGLIKQSGELVAIAHPQKLSGFKNPNSYGAKPVFSSETTNKYFVRKVRAAADSTCEHKVLMPYSPHAPRNMPKETLTNIIGKRYGVHPSTTTEPEYKGQSQVKLADADPESRKPWKTTNKVFQASARVTDMVGLANAGISSDIAQQMHKMQGIYGKH